MKTYLNFESNAPKWIIFSIDVIIVTISLGVSFLLRFNFEIPDSELKGFVNAFVAVLSVRIFISYIFKTYSGVIRHTNIQDLQRLYLATTTGTAVIVVLNLISFYLNSSYILPFSVVIFEYVLTFFLVATFRTVIKMIFQEITSKATEKTDIMIYGAGHNGLTTKQAFDRVTETKFNIMAFIDSNTSKQGKLLEGVKIYGDDDLPHLLQETPPKNLIIAVQNLDKDKKAKIIELALSHNIGVKVIPPVTDWINGELSAKQIKSVKIEELLGRKPIQLDQDKIKSQLQGKTVLVTGAAGSIGSGLVDQIAKYFPEKIIMLDQAETPLYELELRMKEQYGTNMTEIVIGDIRNENRMRNMFREFRPDFVYHAAAYKHVPMMEDNPSEAIRANVHGTKIIADLSEEFEIEKFVMISTDKAVNPTNVMGATKRIAELYTQSKNSQSQTKFITTRFGNVLGSNGSVIPIFRRQIEEGGPLTVTHPDITRFFMTIPEACQLVLEAGMMGHGGEIYIFDMGESVKIVSLAEKMIKLSGLTLGRDIQIKYSGLRPGEKLYEELLANEENTMKTHHSQIMIAKVREADFNIISTEIESLIGLYNSQNNFDIVSQMKKIVPEYVSKNSVYSKLDQ
ncbi:polysaccharide biosynthesis protein [bacterium SCSIO 12643]|nr:polysaccharide biosynthesis protein [bacterium SCSIO 12643]